MHNIPTEEDNETGIALWGPVGSGKDWLVNGFAKELDHYNRTNSDFSFELNDEYGNPITPKPLSSITIKPTAEAEDYFLKFTRRPKVSDHSHSIKVILININIHNDMGGNLMAALSNQGVYGSTYETLMKSKYVIVVLDPTLITHEPNPEENQPNDVAYSSIVEKKSFTPKDYKLAIQTLNCFFTRNGSKKIFGSLPY